MTGQPIDLAELLNLLGFTDTEHLQFCTKAPGGQFHAIVLNNPPAGPAQNVDTWFGPNPVEHVIEGRPGADHITRLAALWVDLDIKVGGCPDWATAHTIVDDLAGLIGTRPVAVTHSGHGLQPLWAVERSEILPGFDADEYPGTSRPAARALLRRWGRLAAAVAERRGARIDSVFDLPRILRCPGTTNHKQPHAPVPVITIADTGAPLDIDQILDALDENGITDRPEDHNDPGAIISAPAEWEWATNTCNYATQTAIGWSRDTPTARHPWLVSQAVRLAAMHRNGCLTATHYGNLHGILTGRFRALISQGADARPEGPGEISDAIGAGQLIAAAKTPDQLAAELGRHPHGAPPDQPPVKPKGPVPDAPRHDPPPTLRSMLTSAQLSSQPQVSGSVASGATQNDPGHQSHEPAQTATPPATPEDLAFHLEVEQAARHLHVADEARKREQIRRHETAHPTGTLDLEYIDGCDLDQLPTPDPLIEGVLSRHSLAILRGRDGTYKTFVALDWALSMATGRPWQGKRTERVPVLYIAGEGAYGIASRKAAWEMAWGKVDRGWFTLRKSAVNLFAGGPIFEDMLTRIHDGKYGMVVVDTLRRASGGADGNSTDMGVVIDNMDLMKRATANGTVLTITHTDKGDNDTRGWSGIEDDIDIVWHAKVNEDTPHVVALSNTKAKDNEAHPDIELETEKVLRSVILQSRTPGGDTEELETDRRVLGALAAMFSTTGATVNQVVEATGIAKTSVYRARGRLEKAGQIVLTQRGAGHIMTVTISDS